MKILELTNYSAGICGVWQRVKQESELLAEIGHEVLVMSSNAIKGINKIAPDYEKIGKIKIFRFSFRKLGGESFMYWNFEKKALEFSPDVIIAHAYRHPHTLKALRVAEKLRRKGKVCKVFLVTHAPFERRESRSLISKIIVWFYDKFIILKHINKFDKILTITKWEIPFLLRLGAKKEKIKHIPNGIPDEFFIPKKKAKIENKILFLGRITPIKNLEILIQAMKFIKNKKIKLEIVGPAEENYFKKLKLLIKSLKLESKIIFSQPIYNLKEKIKKIDSAKIFVLSSKSEGMPQSLIEAMAREKIVIGSDIPAHRYLIKDKENGFLFEFDNPRDLAKKINEALEKKDTQMQKKAKKSVENFSWNNVIKKILEVIK